MSAYFTTLEYEHLRTILDEVERMRFLFGEPRFLHDVNNGGLVPPAFALDKRGLRPVEQIKQRAVAQRCADWISPLSHGGRAEVTPNEVLAAIEVVDKLLYPLAALPTAEMRRRRAEEIEAA